MKWNREEAGPWMQRLLECMGKYKYVFLVLAVGIFLLILPERTQQEEMTITAAQATASNFDLNQMERELECALSQIDGAGDVTVVLTLRSSSRRILAQDTQTDQRETSMETDKSTVVISRGSGVQDAVLLQEIYPSFQGAFVVCPGGDDPVIRLKLSEAVSALTGLTLDKISICKGK